MKNHLRTHPPELRVQRFRKQQAHREREIHSNTDDIDNDAFHFNFNFHGNGEEDNDNDDESDDDDGEVDNRGQRSSNTPRVNLSATEEVQYHPIINGRRHDALGNPLPPDAPPPPWEERLPSDYSPFSSRESFLLADLLFRRAQMSAGNIDDLMEYIACLVPPDQDPPFSNSRDLYETIDAAKLGQVPWRSFTLSYQPAEGENISDVPWKSKTFEVWFRDPQEVLKAQLSNRDFANEMDFAAKKVFDAITKQRRYQDFMSGEWAWEQSDILAQDEQNHGAVFCPIFLGSDKTTVSVATGQNEYYPLYMSNGLIYNTVRRGHRNGVSVIGFLAIPKTDREHDDSKEFREFRRAIFHASLTRILKTLKKGMSKPVLLRYADGYYRWTIYGLGPYIADYPEQVLLSCVVQDWCPKCTALNKDLDGEIGGRRSHEHTEALVDALDEKVLWFDYGIVSNIMPFTHEFPRADIHELLSPDILHQMIKGTFKDHLVTWVVLYIKLVNAPREAKKILADIDRRISVVPLFPGLRRFPEGRGFKQWTGNDSKALMKVFLPAIVGHVPPQMVRAIATFTEFCYIVRRSVITTEDLVKLDELLAQFHLEREIFRTVGVRADGFNLPRQHSLKHYRDSIRRFGAPNGLCSSITESRHITAVRKPWRRSSHFNALGQMLVTNQRLDQLDACAVNFRARGMLYGVPQPSQQTRGEDGDEDDDGGAVDDKGVMGEVELARKPIPKVSRKVLGLAYYLGIPSLPSLISRFLYSQENPELDVPLNDIPLSQCPRYTGKVFIYASAVATYHAPSDTPGINGLFRERIRSVASWRKGPERRDCVFVEQDANAPGFRGMFVAQVLSFLKLKHNGTTYPCALVSWFSTVGDEPCPQTGMWIVQRDRDENGRRELSIIHLETILRAAHLIGIAGDKMIPHGRVSYTNSLNAFKTFYVNKFIDYHAHEIAF
ncbi:hypothetical protein F5887DRAFT_899548 [Amanita rubescens]|nr:hypothetical protein F5887DRAFT_899548 [Amanita rubescens]